MSDILLDSFLEDEISEDSFKVIMAILEYELIGDGLESIKIIEYIMKLHDKIKDSVDSNFILLGYAKNLVTMYRKLLDYFTSSLPDINRVDMYKKEYELLINWIKRAYPEEDISLL